MKLDGLGCYHIQIVLQVFLIFLISLLLICLLLSAMWTQQMTISSVIICTTAVSILTYASTIVVSILRPVSLFQIPRAELMGDILEHVHTYRWGSFLMVRPLNYLPSAAY
ncbi:hypothetical protein BD769DRAFT_416478 [Suillus cothurnatus]|nr:hypothetical protein BD769DRAFT_416478 [Suillus cothurnatus]